jgi:hypothetical protein
MCLSPALQAVALASGESTDTAAPELHAISQLVEGLRSVGACDAKADDLPIV